VHYAGVELSRDALAAAAVLDSVVRGTSADVHDDPFHVLLAFHVLEHIRDVEAEMRRWRRLLADDGVVIVEVPTDTGHPLLSWDANPEHLHYFTAASLAALCHRSGMPASRLATGHFESVVYPDSLRVFARPRVDAARRKALLLDRFRAVLGTPFAVYGIGGDFHNYVEPLLDELHIAALLDSNPDRQGSRIGRHTVSAYDPARHGNLPLLVASVRFKSEIASQLGAQHAVSPGRIIGLDDIYGESALYNDDSRTT
jgi:hypothetical protein